MKDLNNLTRKSKATAQEEQKNILVEVTNTTYKVQEQEEQIKLVSLNTIEQALNRSVQANLQAKEAGQADILQTFVELRKMQNTIENAIKELQAHAIEEASKLSREEQKQKGVQIGYSAEYLNFSEDAEFCELERKLQARKELIKLASQGKILLDEATGEIIQKVSIKTPAKAYLKLS